MDTVPTESEEQPAERMQRLLMMEDIVDPLLRGWECANLLECSRATWWRLVKKGIAPKTIKIGSLSRWRRHVVVDLVNAAEKATSA